MPDHLDEHRRTLLRCFYRIGKVDESTFRCFKWMTPVGETDESLTDVHPDHDEVMIDDGLPVVGMPGMLRRMFTSRRENDLVFGAQLATLPNFLYDFGRCLGVPAINLSSLDSLPLVSKRASMQPQHGTHLVRLGFRLSRNLQRRRPGSLIPSNSGIG